MQNIKVTTPVQGGNLWELLAPSPLDTPISVTIFPNVLAATLDAKQITLRQLAGVICRQAGATKSDLPLLKLGKHGDVLTIKGSLRHDANLLSVSGIEGDYDAGEVGMQEFAHRLRAAGIACLIYTTPSHTPEVPKLRVLVPLARPVAPSERAAHCARLNGALGGILAPESFTASQSYYFGSVPGHPVELILVDGQPLDRVTGVAPIGPQPKPAKSATDLSDLLRISADPACVRRALAAITDADDRNQWLKIGMALHDEYCGSETGFDLWSNWSKQSGKFDARDQVRKWKSFRREGIGIGTLYQIASAYGWRPIDVTQDDFDDLPPIDKPNPSSLRFLTPDDCASAPSRGYLIKGLIAPRDVACIFGAPGAGKSLIAPFLGYMVARGDEAFRMRSKAGGVFYVAAEDSDGMRGRVRALRQAHGNAPVFKLVEGVSQLLSTNSGEPTADLLALVEAVKAERPALIVIDTLAMAFPGLDENSAQDMGRVVAVARRLTRWGAAVVLIHHDTKAEGGTPRGHGILNGALDVALQVRREEDGIIRGKLTKNRNGTCDRDIAFVIATEDGGTDEDGDAITLPRCSPLTGAPAKVQRLSPQAGAALKILDHLPRPVTRDDWKRACMASDTVCAKESDDTRRKAFDRALETLARAEWITVNDGCYSTADGFDDLDGHGQSPDISDMSDPANRQQGRTDTDTPL
ncbi:MAG: AAA family ATPase [Gemmobacter sp.]